MDRQARSDESASTAEVASSLAATYDAHVREVYRYIHRRCRDHSLAEDITQETFLTAFRHAGDSGSISIGWLLTVARNQLTDVLRRETGSAKKLRLVGAGQPDDVGPDVVERLRLNAALQELRIDHRLVLTLHYLDGLSVPAIAQELDRSVKSIEGLVTRARRELRALLTPDAYAETGEAHG